jgi:hypothetical protein
MLLFAACGPRAGSSPPRSGEWLEFGGSWTATGVRHVLELGPERRTAVFELSGSLQLTGAQRPEVGFRAQALGLSDSSAGMQGHSVWTDARGDEVFSELKGEAVAGGNRITGKITGGTGRYAGVTGEYSFHWQYLLESEDGSVSGRGVDFQGRARLAPSASAEPPTR